MAKIDCEWFADTSLNPRCERWLSVPGSRICANYEVDWGNHLRPVEYSDDATLKLNVLYYAPGGPCIAKDLERLLMWHVPGAGIARLSSNWNLYSSGYDAAYSNGVSATVTDFLYDENTLVRRTRFENPAEGLAVVLSGIAPFESIESAAWDEDANGFVIGDKHMRVAILVREKATAHGVHALAAGDELVLNGEGKQAGNCRWLIELRRDGSTALREATDTETEFLVAAGFATADEGGKDKAVERAKAALADDPAQALARRKDAWEQILAKVPEPTALWDDAQQCSYYKAWAFTLGSILPPCPEYRKFDDYRYNHRFVTCGKQGNYYRYSPCLVSSWDSLLPSQHLVYVDSELAWENARVAIDQIADDGSFRSEQLPSRLAQPLWQMHQVSPNRDALAELYPPVKQHLLWIEDRNAYFWQKYPDESDCDFLISNVYDEMHASKIAAILGLDDDLRMWDEHVGTLFQRFLDRHYESPDKPPFEYHYGDTGERMVGRKADGYHAVANVVQGLVLPQLSGQYAESMITMFRQKYNPDAPFAGFDGYVETKYTDISLMLYGLLDRGMKEEAETVCRCFVRDIAAANAYGEGYHHGSHTGIVSIKPSTFGAMLAIECAVLLGGVRVDKGEKIHE